MDIFVKRPIVSLVVSAILILAGLFAATKISVLQFPKIESASLSITTSYPGASAEVVQGFITDPIERAAMTVPGVDFVDSNTVAGLSTVTAWLELNEDSTRALAELTTRINQIKYELPQAAEDPAVELKRADRPNALFYLDVQSDIWSRAEVSNYLQRQVTPILSSIDGVQKVGLEGGRLPAMRIWLDPQKMTAFNLGASEVLAGLNANNIVAALGKAENANQQIHLLSNATLTQVDEFEELVIAEQGGYLIRLGDIARIEMGEEQGNLDARYNKENVIYISIWPLPGANEIAIGDEVYKRLASISETLPEGLTIDTGYDATIYMRNALKEILTTLVETVILVGIVVILLMGSFRSAMVPLVTIPISILGAIAAMHMMGFTLNLLTILAIVLSVGLVVDDAIVVVENVARHMREGKGRFEAALISSRELLSPIIAMTFTLAAVYTPIGFVSGLTGSLFKEFAFTLAVAVVMSGIVAITLSPIMSAKLNQEKGRQSKMTVKVNNLFDVLKDSYESVLTKSFGHRNQIIFAGVMISLLLVPLYMFSAKELAPIEDQSSISMIIEAPPAASLEYTNLYMDNVIETVSQNPEFKFSWQVITANGGFGGIEMVDFGDRDRSVHDKLPEVFGQLSGISGLKVFPVLPSALPTAGNFDVEMVIQSPNSYQDMQPYAYMLMEKAMQSGLFMFADTDLEISQPQTRLNFDHKIIADLGLNISQISEQLQLLVAEQYVNRFDSQGKAYKVIPMVEGQSRLTPEQLLDLPIKLADGSLVPLGAMASLSTETAPRSLGKFNQQRSFRILAATLPHATNDQALQVLEKAAKELLPKEYTVDYAGVSRQLRKEGNSMMSVLLIALVVVYLALAVQFNSLRLPLVVLLGSVPLALSGAMVFSFVDMTTINIYSQIGFVTLVGLIAKNGILITEFAEELQRKGVAKLQAITESAKLRLRPILMTTAATVLGHFPLVLVTGAGAEARNSIGIILVAGMAIGTLFTLFILPNIYLLFAREHKDSVDESNAQLAHQ